MANPTLLSYRINRRHRYSDTVTAFALFIVIRIVVLLTLLSEVRTESPESTSCSSVCSCLGPFADCSKRSLTEVPKDVPTWMEILDLSFNELSDDAVKEMRGFPSLTELKLNKNLLTKVPSLNDMPQLSSLALTHNEIQRIDYKPLSNVTSLKYLDLSTNRISNISLSSFPVRSDILILSLNSNRISAIERGSFDNLPFLVELRLNRNRLSKFRKDVFRHMRQLRVLELNRNHFTEIAGLSFQGLENLAVLKLRRNNIRTLQDGAFWGLRNISVLQLDMNNITIVTKAWLYGLNTLLQLTLSDNHISKIGQDGWEFCEQLVELDLSNNRLEAIDTDTLQHLSKLQKLILDGNRISYIAESAFNNTPALEVLEMNNNRISTTIEDTTNGAFLGLNHLLRFGLASNNIKSITKRAFIGLGRLRRLDLSNNNITSVQENAFSEMLALQELLINTSSLLCDCKLQWFPAWLEKTQFQTSVEALCLYPDWLKGTPLVQVQDGNFSCDDFPKPRIVEDPKGQVALKGGNATLRCKAVSSSQEKMTLLWKKDNVDLQTGNITEFARSPNGKGMERDSVLFLANITDRDTGRYQCVASNMYGTTYSMKVKIAVLIFPTFVKTPGNVTVKTKNTARLECAARGQPPPEIAWQKDGGNDFPAARERRMHVMPTDDVFFILNVQTVDMGTYSCTAQNPAGVIVANASLTVEEAPSFVKPMENKEITAGEPIVLECMASGSPKPKLIWRKDGKELVVTERHFFTADDQLLVIVDTDLPDAGSYECEMSNSLGVEQGISQLSVIPVSSPNVNEGDMTGIIIITVVCCAVGTSVVWVVIIYQTRKRMGIIEVRNDEHPFPGTLLANTTATDDRDSTPHLYLDTNSEHSSGSKDSGTGDSAGKRSSDNLLLGSGVNGLVINMAGSNEGTNNANLDAVTTPPVLRSNFHPRRTNHDRCVCPRTRSKRWSDPHAVDRVPGTHLPHHASYHSLPKNLQRDDSNSASQVENADEELVPCIPATGAQ